MQKSKIEWTEYTSNPVKGKCPVGCPFCYAEAIRHRFHRPEEITFHPGELEAIKRHKKPVRIFVGSAIELFHDETIPYFWRILETVRECQQHTFIFLTKCPQNLPKEWPDNCWVGQSITSNNQAGSYIGDMLKVKAKVKFLSIEPLLQWADLPLQRESLPMILKRVGINWIIIGAQTPYREKTAPKEEWIREIVDAADAAGISVFLKDNLRKMKLHFSLLNGEATPFYKPDEWGYLHLRQEFP